MKFILVLFIVVICCNINAQKSNKFFVEFGYGINSYSMSDLNNFFIDDFAIPNGQLNDKIGMGVSGFANIKFQPMELFDIGVYGSYQFGKTNGDPEITTYDDFGNPIETFVGTFMLKTEATGIGLTNSWYINHLLKFKDKENKFLQRFRIATELNVGIGFSKAIIDIQYPTDQITSFYDFYNSTGFHGQFALKFEYDYVRNPIIGTIGLKIGYQYLKTKTLKDRQGNNWIVLGEHPINLDFSGFFGAIYLGFGK